MPHTFLARENIRRYKAALQAIADETRKATIRELLEQEERHLRDLLAGRDEARRVISRLRG